MLKNAQIRQFFLLVGNFYTSDLGSEYGQNCTLFLRFLTTVDFDFLIGHIDFVLKEVSFFFFNNY